MKISKRTGKTISLYLNSKLHDLLVMKATQEGRSVSNLINNTLLDGLKSAAAAKSK